METNNGNLFRVRIDFDIIAFYKLKKHIWVSLNVTRKIYIYIG